VDAQQFGRRRRKRMNLLYRRDEAEGNIEGGS
jgi:hypothetical protein